MALKNENNSDINNFRIDYKPIVICKNYFKTYALLLLKKLKVKEYKLFYSVDDNSDSLNSLLENTFYNIPSNEFMEYEDIRQEFNKIDESMNDNEFNRTNLLHKITINNDGY